MSVTLYVAISSHGYGHIAQTAPVVNELYQRSPCLRVVIECATQREILARRFDMPFEHVSVASDFGMVMKNAMEVDVAASHVRYLEAHARLDADVHAASNRLVEHRANVLFTNVTYLPLIAAGRIGVPAIAMCSLNWADIYEKICGTLPGAQQVHDEMLRAYGGADTFMALEPSMDMPGLANARSIGPVASVRNSIRSELFTTLRLADGARLVTVSMGGITMELPLARWPRVPGVTWVMPDNTDARRNDMVTLSTLGKPFLDIMCSSDALITKPGYGGFVEAACNDIPVLYVPRINWPEAPFLVRWLHEHGRCREISYDELFSGRLEESLHALWELPSRQPVAPCGTREAADVLAEVLAAVMPTEDARATK